MTTVQLMIFLALLMMILIMQGIILFGFWNIQEQKENEYYTDYIHNQLILRVYKPEFEYQAIGKISKEKILDSGNLTMTYKWALIEK